MTSKRCRTYCSVYGCLNKDTTHPELSFFRIPPEQETRLLWLRSIDREDLTNSPNKGRVCEVHFKSEDISYNTHRKQLRKNCCPSLHLPNIKVDKETQIDKILLASTLVDTSTQIEIPTCDSSFQTVKVLRSDNITQTNVALSANTPRKRKLKTDLSSLKKRLRELEKEQTLNSSKSRNMFFKLCDNHLSKNLADIVKAQVLLKSSSKGNRYTLAYKMFCLNLYYARPQAYHLLQQTLCLPCRATLNKLSVPITSQINDDLMAALKLKVNNMSDREKQCTIIVGAMSLKTNLYYNIKDDKIVGFQEVDGVQSPSPANFALVVLIRGIFVKWSRAIGFALISECKSDDNISKWIDKIIIKLLEIGLKIRVFVSDLGVDLLQRDISAEKPYFTVNDHKIYYIFDAPHLLKLLRNNFIKYDFHLNNGGVAKYEHLVRFYEDDKNKIFRLAYKLTDSHINPTSSEKSNVRYATQLLSRSVAGCISTYIDFQIIDESARETVEFIKNMNDLFDLLNSSTYRHSNVYKRAFCGNIDQVVFFNNMLIFFQTLKLCNPRNGNDVTKAVKFIDGFQITIKSILHLYEDLKQEGFKYLLTRHLNQDDIENFFEKIRSKIDMARDPTSRQFISAYKKIYFANITEAPKEGNSSEDLTEFLINLNSHQPVETGGREIDELLTSRSDISLTQGQGSILCEILCSDYSQLQLPEHNSFFYVCGALLKKCVDYHKDCETLKAYVDVNQRSCNSRTLHIDFKNFTEQHLLMVPPDDFVANIERIEQVFLQAFEKDQFTNKIGTSIYEHLKEIQFTMPCPCFPLNLLRKLYIRMRLYFTIAVNNKAYRTPRNRLTFFPHIYDFV